MCLWRSAWRVEGLLEWMDKAALIVCYNGHAFDMRVLTRHYDGDNERQERHARKLLDPIVATTRAAGSSGSHICYA